MWTTGTGLFRLHLYASVAWLSFAGDLYPSRTRAQHSTSRCGQFMHRNTGKATSSLARSTTFTFYTMQPIHGQHHAGSNLCNSSAATVLLSTSASLRYSSLNNSMLCSLPPFGSPLVHLAWALHFGDGLDSLVLYNLLLFLILSSDTTVKSLRK